MNSASSRSHCIFTINVEQSSADDVNNVVISKLQLVDLAGSERAGLTGNTGVAYKESIDINKSLLTLRKVINGLSDNKASKGRAHIPYRESKLTCLLKQSLGGNSYCLMIACLPPSDAYLDENISTLTYATKASYIANVPNKNEDPRMKIIHELRKKCNSLEKELKVANDHILFLSSLTGAIRPENNKDSYTENNSGHYEEEVRIIDKIPQSTNKGDSTIGGDDDITDSMRRELLLHQQKSTPVQDHTQFDDGADDFKSEEPDETGKTTNTTKKLGKKAKAIQNAKAAAQNSNIFCLTL